MLYCVNKAINVTIKIPASVREPDYTQFLSHVFECDFDAAEQEMHFFVRGVSSSTRATECPTISALLNHFRKLGISHPILTVCITNKSE
jgi:hypothetical protein